MNSRTLSNSRSPKGQSPSRQSAKRSLGRSLLCELSQMYLLSTTFPTCKQPTLIFKESRLFSNLCTTHAPKRRLPSSCLRIGNRWNIDQPSRSNAYVANVKPTSQCDSCERFLPYRNDLERNHVTSMTNSWRSLAAYSKQ